MTKLGTLGGGLALARQVKVVLSAVLRGSNVRVLVNDGLEPDTKEIVTLASPLDKRVLPLSQVTSISDRAISVSVAGLMEMVQVRVRGSIRPANRLSGGAVTATSGVETVWEDTQVATYMYTIEVALLRISSSSVKEGISGALRAGEVKVPLQTKLPS